MDSYLQEREVTNCSSVILNLLDVLHGAAGQLDLNYESGQLLRFYYGLRKVMYLGASHKHNSKIYASYSQQQMKVK